MGRRSDHSRQELHELALTAAWEIAEKEGLRGLTGRRIAREIGYTVGTLYNLFDDLDDLISQLIGRVLGALYDEVKGLPLDGEPESGLRSLAAGYIRFTGRHPKLWSLIFEHRLPEGRDPPTANQHQVLELLGLVERAISPLFPPGREAERLHVARVLWSSLHGICSLESADKLADAETSSAMLETLIAYFLAGLREEVDEPAPPRSTTADIRG